MISAGNCNICIGTDIVLHRNKSFTVNNSICQIPLENNQYSDRFPLILIGKISQVEYTDLIKQFNEVVKNYKAEWSFSLIGTAITIGGFALNWYREYFPKFFLFTWWIPPWCGLIADYTRNPNKFSKIINQKIREMDDITLFKEFQFHYHNDIGLYVQRH